MENDYYHPVRIGSLQLAGNIFLAPTAGYSNAAFRSICAKMGADFAYTELVSSEAVVRNSNKTEKILCKGTFEKKYSVQLFGGNSDNMAKATKIILEKYPCDCIDINLGCPMPKINRSNGGAVLMREPALLYKVVLAVVKAAQPFQIPVSVKMRSGWNEHNLNWKECAKVCIDAGVKAIAFHPRTRSQKYSGKANWNLLAEMVDLFGGQVNIFGSGDLFTPEDVLNMFEQTKCQAVMIARGAMGNPFIFQQTKDLLLTGSYIKEIPVEAKLKITFEELTEMLKTEDEKTACLQMRKKFAKSTKGIKNGGSLREQLMKCTTPKEYKTVIDNFMSPK